uniref:Syntaxin N-terminal domain-containing protein n=1 Tax=Nelumbo nucifera TaxID=4432 RepID=A0A822YT80_NELNU|nr:TPA_asm: hypothetical protein HUJ06_004955 [Nelumbo nucifera]
MNNLIIKPFLSYVDMKKEAMKDLEAGNVELEMVEAEMVKEISFIRDILRRLQQTNEESKCLHKLETLKALHTRTNADISQLEDMDCTNAANRRLCGYREGMPMDRTRTSITIRLQKKQRMMVEYKAMVGCRYFTVTGEYPEEEVIEKIISSGAVPGTGGEELLQRAVQEHGREGKVLETMLEIQDKHGTVWSLTEGRFLLNSLKIQGRLYIYIKISF